MKLALEVIVGIAVTAAWVLLVLNLPRAECPVGQTSARSASLPEHRELESVSSSVRCKEKSKS